MKIERATHAVWVNKVVNDPSVYPWVKGSHTEPLDLTKAIANPNNIALVSEHGCILFIKIQAGIYEFHTSLLPEGRGAWMQEGAQECFHWMFTKTDAYELMTKCPDNNIAAKMGARNVGCSLQFRTGNIWPVNDTKVSCDIYSLLIQNWVIKAPKLEEAGHWFHENLMSEYKRLDKQINVVADDIVHDRYVGAALEMIKGGQVLKAVCMYNRWAVMSGYLPISVVNKDPLVLDIHEAKIRINKDSFEVV